MLAGGGGAQIIYSAAADHQAAPHAGAVSPHYLLPLGYEPYDAGLYRPGQSPVTTLTSANPWLGVVLDLLRLPSLSQSRSLRFTNWLTESPQKQAGRLPLQR